MPTDLDKRFDDPPRSFSPVPIWWWSGEKLEINRMRWQMDQLHAMGIRNVVAVTGKARMVGDYPDATTVFDVDSVGLTNVIARLNHGLDVGGQGIGTATAFHIGVMVNPGAEDLDSEVRRFEYKVEAGAEFAITRPVYDAGTFERLYKRIESARIPILAGVLPFESVVDAEFMANEVPGVRVPDQVLERMRGAKDADAASAQGIAIARDALIAVRGMVQGVHIAAPGGRIDAALAVLDGIGV